MGTKTHNNYEDLITFTRASAGHALRPVSYGAELVTNGTFDTDVSGWSSAINSTATATSGELVVTGVSASGRQVASISTTVGQVYRLTGEARVSTGSGTALLAVSDTTGGLAERGFVTTTETTATNLQLVFVATQSTHYVTAGNGSSGTGDKIFDNISVKEVLFDQPDGTLTLFEHPNNVPRVEYDADGNRLGLLVEEARTNLVNYSEDFTKADWVKVWGGGATVTGNAGTGPDKQENMNLITPTTTTGGIYRFPTVSLSTQYTSSVFLKAGTNPSTLLRWYENGVGPVSSLVIDWTNGVPSQNASSSGVSNVSFDSFGNGLYRVSFTTTSGSTSTTQGLVIAAYNALGTFYAGYAQVEAGSFPTSYIKSNSGSTTTRSADVASIPVADFGYNQSEGSVVVEFQVDRDVDVGGTGIFMLTESQGSTAEVTRLYLRSIATLGYTNRTNGANDVDMTISGGAVNPNELTKVGVAYKENDFAAVRGGGTMTTDQTGSPATHKYLELRNAEYLNGHIKSIKYYPRRLSNAQLQALTS